ncbi:MAG: HepT-like ribonuclease domain-containing protein [Nanoarchaeota archaeon]
MKRDELLFLEDILESITNIEKFSKGLTKDKFIKDKLKQSAIIRQIEVIGEAVKNISDKTATSQIDF